MYARMRLFLHSGVHFKTNRQMQLLKGINNNAQNPPTATDLSQPVHWGCEQMQRWGGGGGGGGAVWAGGVPGGDSRLSLFFIHLYIYFLFHFISVP